MKYAAALIILILNLALNFSVFASSESPENSIASAVFAEDLPKTDVSKDQKAFGTAIPGNYIGWGLVYRQNLNLTRYVWLRGIYGTEQYVFLDKYAPSKLATNVDIRLKSRVQIVAGVDQRFHLTDNKRWGFLVGIGLGVNQSKYQSRYYPQLCYRSFCGFDPNNPFEKNETDTYGFLQGNIGVGLFDRQVFGLKGDFKIVIEPLIARTGHFEFIGPDNRTYTQLKFTSYTIEGVVRF